MMMRAAIEGRTPFSSDNVAHTKKCRKMLAQAGGLYLARSLSGFSPPRRRRRLPPIADGYGLPWPTARSIISAA